MFNFKLPFKPLKGCREYALKDVIVIKRCVSILYKRGYMFILKQKHVENVSRYSQEIARKANNELPVDTSLPHVLSKQFYLPVIDGLQKARGSKTNPEIP